MHILHIGPEQSRSDRPPLQLDFRALDSRAAHILGRVATDRPGDPRHEPEMRKLLVAVLEQERFRIDLQMVVEERFFDPSVYEVTCSGLKLFVAAGEEEPPALNPVPTFAYNSDCGARSYSTPPFQVVEVNFRAAATSICGCGGRYIQWVQPRAARKYRRWDTEWVPSRVLRSCV